jgi:hypothetical protein
MSPRTSRRSRRVVASLAAAAAVVGLVGTSASAAPDPWDAPPPGVSRAMANGLNVRLLGSDQLVPDSIASNDGTYWPYITSTENAITQDLPDAISVGIVGQKAWAFPTPSAYHLPDRPLNSLVSAACSGLIAENSMIEIQDTGDCAATTAPSDGIRLDLGGIGLRGGAAYSWCAVDSAGYWRADSTFAQVRLVTPAIPPLIPEVTLLDVPVDPARNFGLDLGIAQVKMNKTTIVGGAQDGNEITDSSLPLPADATGIMVEALDVTVGGALGVETGFRIGQSVCYKSPAALVAPEDPVVPAEGAPVAAATLVGMAGLGFVGSRRRNRATVAA